ncbi:MAG: metallophosphoesterase [Actinomycetota bacterium]|nr:metallophosphoesterase [Actinomycetota bacterium]
MSTSRTRSSGPKVAAALSGAATAGLGYAALVERRWYRLRQVTVPVLRPDAARPLRLLHLSDLHLTPAQDHKRAFVRTCLQARPDVVVATGDLLGHADAVDPAVELLAAAARDRPAVAVLGSHDFWEPTLKNPFDYLLAPDRRVRGAPLDTDRLVDGLTAAGWQLLDNRRVAIGTAAGPIDIAGLGDPHVDKDRPELVDWSRPAAAATALRLAVVHAPYRRALDTFDRHGFDLALAGHTHGGQLRLPGVGALVANCDLPLAKARGLSRHGAELWLHVSAGLGTSRYAPLRFACRPEATLLDIVPGRG